MRISKLEFENFRNFRGHYRIDFATDGSVNIIYGPNGVGKTTLHQLFQWIFYGETHFNETASNRMYNLQLEQEASLHALIKVEGTIDFEHPNRFGVIEQYSIHREWVYRKELDNTPKQSEQVKLLKKNGDDWGKIQKDPRDVIEQILPSGLSQYFFFDGESMIADLGQKGRDSAKSLRKALYNIFDLNIYEHALVHIGVQGNGTSTVLGKLFLSRADDSTDKDIIVARGQFRQATKKVEEIKDNIKRADEQIATYRDVSRKCSEAIGKNASKKALEDQRKSCRSNIKTIEELIDKEMLSFGKTVVGSYPYLFISRIVEEAELRIGLKVEDQVLLPGLEKQLIQSLLEETTCICGNHIGDKERASLEGWLRMFPPLSYKYIYDQFKKSAARWSSEYDSDALKVHIDAIFDYKKRIEGFHRRIQEIDDELKTSQNVDQYIEERRKAERSISYWEGEKQKLASDFGYHNQILKQRTKKLENLLNNQSSNKAVDLQIEIMEEVKAHFDNLLTTSANKYSKQLGNAIQTLVNRMLTSTRKVYMSPRFELSVRDSFDDEAKSEGQFAVISFAYIGGIFKLLGEVPELKDKEFPLVLDGPFSKLDVIQRQNVINTIPTYAPQVILFSKDDLGQCFPADQKLNVWTIYSNEERNVSRVEKGYNPEVFSIDGYEI